MRISLLSLLFLSVLAACSLDVEDPVVSLPTPPAQTNPDVTAPITGALDLNALRVGQAARYRYFSCTGFPTHLNEDVQYAEDTLVLKVVEEGDKGFRVAEYLEAGSASLRGQGALVNPDSVFSYYLRSADDQLHVEPRSGTQLRSRLFGYSINAFPQFQLTAVSGPDVTNGWEGEWCACEKYASAEYVNIDGTAYQNLNLLLDNRQTQVDGLGLLFHYDPNATFVRNGFHDPFANRAYGWDLLAE